MVLLFFKETTGLSEKVHGLWSGGCKT